MRQLERVLMRALLDRDFLNQLKRSDYDPSTEFGLSDQEKELLTALRSLRGGLSPPTDKGKPVARGGDAKPWTSSSGLPTSRQRAGSTVPQSSLPRMKASCLVI